MSTTAVAEKEALEQDPADEVLIVKAKNIVPGKYNPRTFFDPDEMAELEGSVRVMGIITPMLVRPLGDGKYEIVAGERRWRAVMNTWGEEYEIPVLSKQITDEQVSAFALNENKHRAGISPAEEAIEASKVLGRNNGDRTAAAQELCWSSQKLEQRLALMNCSEGVLRALTVRKIQLGHAELLAATPKPKQDKVLEKLLAEIKLTPVSEFRMQLAQIAMSLETAIFDKAECAACPRNSSMQASMFTETIGKDGHCTDGGCFKAKTNEVLEARKKELEEEYPTVRIVQPGDNHTIVKLQADGATGVGEEQAKACRACKDFGACISNVPGKVGNVYRDMCFDGACNAKKVSERIKAQKDATKPKAPASAASTGAGGSGKGKSESTQPKKVTSVQLSQKVVEYRDKAWRGMLKSELVTRPADNLSLLIGIMMTLGGRNVSSTALHKAFVKMSQSEVSHTNIGEAAAAVSTSNDEIRTSMLQGIVVTICGEIEPKHLPDMLKFLQVDLTKHWKVNSDFLNLLTKSEIEVIAEELGLKEAMGGQYAKATSGKKDELIKALLTIKDFDYAGKVAKVMQYAS